MRLAKFLVPVAIAATALALTMPAQAANLKPRGGALVNFSGGTATAKALGDHRYTLVLPAEASIAWYGEAKGKGSTPKIGGFTPKQLAKGWTALGHRKGVGVAATLVWQAADGETSVLVLASDPKVRDDGRLTLKVFTKVALPATLPGYSITVTRAPQTSRAFPVYGSAVTVSGSTVVSTTATAPDASEGRMMYGSTKCFTYSHSVAKNQSIRFGPFDCNGVSVTDQSTVKVSQAAPGQCGKELWSLTLRSGAKTSTMSITPLMWDVNGNAISAGGTCS